MRAEDDERRAVQVSTRLEPELVRAIERRAREQHRSLSNYIAALLADHVDHDRGAAV
jgi:hypothetical protein